MKAFLFKYKWRILYWLVFLTIVLYLAPGQSDYYLDDDISHFKKSSLMPILIGTGVAVSIFVLFFVLAKKKSIKQSVLSFLHLTVTIAFFLFIFRDLFLAAFLFFNRQYKRASLQKTYVVKYIVGADQIKGNFNPYDISTDQISIDNKLINKLYHPGLKEDDTLTLNFDIGLLGIAFQAQPFNDK